MLGLIFRAINHAGKHAHRAAPHAHKVVPHVHKAAPHVHKVVKQVAPTYSVHQAQVPVWIEKGKVFHRHVASWLYKNPGN
jgi:hypothetical protein